MTRNQIEYNRLLETQRANRASEELTRTRDERSYALGQAQLAEAGRHNLQDEAIRRSSLDESVRSNRAREDETARSNRARELEMSRSNRAAEAEAYRSNVARETELNRANLASESQRRAELALDTEIRRGQLAESQRHNRASENISWSNVSLGYSQLAEQSRANRQREYQTQQSISEQHRINTLTSNQRARELAIRAQQQQTQAFDAETRRQAQKLAEQRSTAQNFRDYASGTGSVVNAFGQLVPLF
nr:MAG TPA: hypothetical protein [Picobirnaviridae sp.]